MQTPLTRFEPDSRSWQIVNLIARQGEATVADIGESLGVTATAVRQQLTRLVYEGWLERHRRQGGPGRPADVFSLSDQGRRLFAHDVETLARLLMEEIESRYGTARLHELLESIQERLGRELAGQIGGGDAEMRIRRFVELLRERGTVADSSASPGSLALSVYTCPYHGIAGEHDHICELERQTLSKITGSEVRLERRLVDGHAACEFRVSTAGERGTNGSDDAPHE